MNSRGKNELKSGCIPQEIALMVLSLLINDPAVLFYQLSLLLSSVTQ